MKPLPRYDDTGIDGVRSSPIAATGFVAWIGLWNGISLSLELVVAEGIGAGRDGIVLCAIGLPHREESREVDRPEGVAGRERIYGAADAAADAGDGRIFDRCDCFESLVDRRDLVGTELGLGLLPIRVV